MGSNSRISVSALGRDVTVGDLYNYYTDDILKSGIPVPSECIRIEQKLIPETERYFFFNQPAKFKPSLLGINSHLKQSIDQGSVDLNLLWFADFLRPCQTEDDENEALVTVFFRVVRRTESLDQQFLDSKMYDYQVESGGWATHLVEQVVYGAELICCMRRSVDWRRETKDSAEENIYLVAKAYFDYIIGTKTTIITDPPVELEKVSCRILSSLEDVHMTDSSFRQSCEFLRDIINFKEDNQPAKIWRPIYIVRRQIPKQIETRIVLDRIIDKRLKIERKLHWITKESYRISKHPFLNRIPPLERAMFQFLNLLEPVRNEIKQFDVNHIAKKCVEDLIAKDKISNDMKTISDCALLSDMVSWLIQRRSEIDAIYLLLKGNQMDMFDIAEIESRPPSSSEKRARVFVLKVDYTPDPLMERIQNFIGNLEPVIKLPVFSAITSGKERQGVIGKAFHGFSEEARWCSNENNSYQIGLVSASSPLADATIKTFLYPAIKKSQVCLPAAQSSPVETQKANSSNPESQTDEQPIRPAPINNFLRQSNSPFTHRKKLSCVPNEISQQSNEKVANFLLKSITMISSDIFYDENDG
ncbi:hypothetical protein DAPPUDRAFT_327022 [Daphnia pulex]|uniref:Denn domain-containing protein n=1 Tax=Daphnia pulex TaxID=6669 RepID=E9H9H6_DAPPU|nr:hypothetical protein DAPPUDRAFT_327022 [Daphnia pulex]|eukprot:EFX71619.1 hypothetical protein DAPPUDRAFT_327022 [Daphnia pulex]